MLNLKIVIYFGWRFPKESKFYDHKILGQSEFTICLSFRLFDISVSSWNPEDKVLGHQLKDEKPLNIPSTGIHQV